MTIFNKISNTLKPKTYEYVINESFEEMQLKLETFFTRGFWKSLFDSEYNVTGNFTNTLKNEFKICLTVGPYTAGGANFYYGTLERINTDSTKIILKNYSNIGGIVALTILLLFSVAFTTLWISQNSSNIMTFETLFGVAIIVIVLFIIIKI